MSLAVAVPLLVGGVAYSLMGGDFLVRGAIALARRTRISPMVVGLTVVAFGTSAPELMVALEAVFAGYNEIAISGVVGSNIANVLLVVALPALIYPLAYDQPSARVDALTMMAVSVAFVLLARDGRIGRGDGVLMLVGLMAFLWLQLRSQLGAKPTPGPRDELPIVLGLPQRVPTIVLLLVTGAVMLPVGAGLLIDGAVGLAARIGVSNQVVGLTVIAVGTSVPELSTTLVAALKRQADVAVGNVLGSNILNIVAIMGVASVAAPEVIEVPPRFPQFDLPLMIAAAAILTLVALRKGSVGRVLGGAMLLSYVAYTFLLYAGGG